MVSLPTLNRVAIVTGSSRGIGRAIALRLANDGHNVVVNYHSNQAKAQEVVDQIHSAAKSSAEKNNKTPTTQAIAVQGDAGNSKDSQKIIDAALKAFGRIDTVVFNVGNIYAQTLEQVTEESWEEAFRVNVKGPTFFAQKAPPPSAARCPTCLFVRHVDFGLVGAPESLFVLLDKGSG